MDLLPPWSDEVPQHLAAKFTGRHAAGYWHRFYLRNEDRFYKDRHYFEAEFPQLLQAATVLEVGCGVGNTVFPLLELNPSATVYACDFAASGVDILRRHPLYASSGRVRGFVADITRDALTLRSVPPAAVDACTMVFVLSALTPETRPLALRNVASTLAVGGRVLFRDYAAGDLAQARLGGPGRQQRLGGDAYLRGDGTMAAYFEPEPVRALFEGEGFGVEALRVVEQAVENRRRGAVMERRFMQGVFVLLDGRHHGALPALAGDAAAGAGGEEGRDGGSDGVGDAAAAAAAAAAAIGDAAPAGDRGDGEDGEEGSTGALAEHPVTLAEYPVTLAPGLQLSVCCPAAAPPGAQALALARFLLAAPSLLHNASVVVLGCGGSAALPSLAALRWCRRSVATDTCEACLPLLRGSARLSGHLFVWERLRLAQLAWGDSFQARRVLGALPGGVGVVAAAAPPSLSSRELEELFRAAAALLTERPAGVVVACCGAPSRPGVEEAAAAAGLVPAPWTAALASAAQQAADGLALHLLLYCLND